MPGGLALANLPGMKMFLLILALLFTVSCGKNVKKKADRFETFEPANYIDDIELFMPEIRDLFNEEYVTDFFDADTNVIFVQKFVPAGTNGYLGKSFSATDASANCSHYFIRPQSEILLVTSAYAQCTGPVSSQKTNHEGDYNYALVPDLNEALTLTPERIVMREVTYKGESYVGYGIQKNSAFALSKAYKEYVIIPEFPLVLNPVLTYDSLTGEVRALEGIQVN